MDLRPDQSIVDLGKVRQAEEVPATFRLTNDSSLPIAIALLDAECGCTTPTIDRMRLSPGEVASLEVDWSVGSARGKVDREIRVGYRVGDSPLRTLRLILQGTVEPDYGLSATELVFAPTGLQTVQLELWADRLSTLQVLDAYCTSKCFDVALLPDQKGRKRIQITFHPDAWLGDTHAGELLVETNSKREPTCRIGLRVRSEARQRGSNH